MTTVSWRGRALRVLTAAQTGSAMTLGALLIVNLAMPVAAAVGPSPETANETMLLGREVYQRALTEPLMVWGALGTHVISSMLRRALLSVRSGSARSWKAWLASLWPRGWRSTDWQVAAAYVLAPVLLIHVSANRLAPMTDAPPIRGLSPAELDLSYVSYGLVHRGLRVVSWAAYGLLVLSGTVHWLVGSPKVARRLFPKHPPRPWAYRNHMIIALTLSSVLLLGLGRLANEGVNASPFLLERVRVLRLCGTNCRCMRRMRRCGHTASPLWPEDQRRSIANVPCSMSMTIQPAPPARPRHLYCTLSEKWVSAGQ